jgi:N utilization substance protein A
MNNNELFEALKLLAAEKEMDIDQLLEKIRAALVIAIKRDYPKSENIQFNIDIEKGVFDVAILKEIVEEVEDTANQISLEEARHISSRYKLGDVCPLKLDTKHFGRIAAQTAKQVIKQGIKEVERSQLMEQWGSLQNEAVSATVIKIERGTGNALVDINGNEVTLFRSEQIPGEVLREGQIIKVYVSGFSSGGRPMLKISRTARELIKRLFELEVPEIYEGIVEIHSVSREPGIRSKVAVYSHDENVDAVGSCIGPSRSRITKVCEELNGEKIDLVNYYEDDKEFIKQALRPAQVLSVEIPDETVRVCSVTVPDNQLSLAIGNKGQNAKLAAKLTGYKIDIKPESGFFEG